MVNAKSIANLRPPWTSKTAPRRGGRPNAGMSIIEWRNELATWPRERVEKAKDDKKSPAAKVIAAVEVLAAMDGDKDARRDLCDYTNGKPTQPQEITQDVRFRTQSDGDAEGAALRSEFDTLLGRARDAGPSSN